MLVWKIVKQDKEVDVFIYIQLNLNKILESQIHHLFNVNLLVIHFLVIHF